MPAPCSSISRGELRQADLRPRDGVVLGGTIVGHRASELIGVLTLAVQADVTVKELVETLMVHPSMTEAISDAAE